MDPETKMTRDEWQRETQEENCQEEFHAPYRLLRAFADPLGIWYCECGQITWRPE